MGREAAIKNEVLSISEGLLTTLEDLILALLIFGFVPRFQTLATTDRKLKAITPAAIRRAFYRLKRKGLLYSATRLSPQGVKRLRAVLPFYQKKRVWSGKIYLIVYDIPEAKRRQRDSLRRRLRELGCAQLQDSVWLTVFPPRNLLAEPELNETIIVSRIDRVKGNVRELVERAYRLKELDEEYRDYLNYLELVGITPETRLKLIFNFLAILKKDPQLPSPLLPRHWQGERAYKQFLILNLRS